MFIPVEIITGGHWQFSGCLVISIVGLINVSGLNRLQQAPALTRLHACTRSYVSTLSLGPFYLEVEILEIHDETSGRLK